MAKNIEHNFPDTLVRRDIRDAQRLLNNAKPGDTVFLKGGIYALEGESLAPVVSGTRKAWITIMPFQGEQVIIDGSNYLNSIEKKGAAGSPKKGILTLQNIHFVRIKGIQVRQAHALGIIAEGKNTSNIEIIDCKSDGSFNSGIGIWYADSCKVLNCEITGSNNQALRPEGVPIRGEAPHEALTLAGASHFEVAYNTIHSCYKEGIDCKEVSSYGIIHHNNVYNMPRQGLYVDCWFGRLHNIVFADNKVYNCEWGFAVSAEGEGATMDSVYVDHNLLYNNRASGILFGVWGANGPRSQIYIYNNTIYNNGRKGHWSGLTGGIDIMSSNIANVFIYNNISAFNYGYAIASSVPPPDLGKFLSKKNIQITNNLEWQVNKPGEETPKGMFKQMYPMRGKKATIAPPGFVNADKSDFRLTKSSSARGSSWKKAQYGKTNYLGPR